MKRKPKTILVHVVQGYYEKQWEDLCASEVYKEAREDIKAYRLNEPGRFRLIKRREPNPEYVCPTP